MGEHKYKYILELDEPDKINIIKGLFKTMEGKAEEIKQICADGRIDGKVYDSETEAMYLILNDM